VIGIGGVAHAQEETYDQNANEGNQNDLSNLNRQVVASNPNLYNSGRQQGLKGNRAAQNGDHGG
jgi:hypothetical protein